MKFLLAIQTILPSIDADSFAIYKDCYYSNCLLGFSYDKYYNMYISFTQLTYIHCIHPPDETVQYVEGGSYKYILPAVRRVK